MFTKRLQSLTVLLVVSMLGCAERPVILRLASAYEARDVAWFSDPGPGSIEGSALLRKRDGAVVTCGGTEVVLRPRSAYAEERVTAMYGSPRGGFRPIGPEVQFEPESDTYRSTDRRTVCDAQGKFKFKNLPAGRYYVVAKVTWEVPSGSAPVPPLPQGGFLLKPVDLGADEHPELVLTDN